MAGIIIQGITPNLKIQGASQAFKFGWDTLPPPIGSLSLENAYIPSISSNSFTNFNFKNNTLSGFRLLHETSTTDTIGQLKLQSFIGDSPTGTDILTFGNDGSINFISPLVISADLNMNGFKITDLATPVLPTDGVNKAYADSLVSGGTVTLIGAVTGSGSVGSNITTTLNSFDSEIALPFGQLNLNWNNTLNSDPFVFNNSLTNTSAFIKQYIYRISSTTNINTRNWDIFYDLGDPTEPYGEIKFEFNHPLATTTTVTPFRIQTFPNLGGSGTSFLFLNATLDMQSNSIVNLNNPALPTDGANKGYIDNKTWLTSQITDYTTATNSLIANATIAISKLAGYPANTTTYLRGDGSWSDLSTAINSNFGSSVTLPFNQLSFNWAYTAGSNPASYELANNLTDNQISKNFKYRIATNDVSSREWNHNYTLIGNSDLNGLYEINYKVLSTTFTPFSISIYPFATSQNLLTISVPVSMGGFEVRDALNPTQPQSLATKSYVDSKIITLTGAVTGSGASSFATTLASSQTVSGTTQTFNYSNLLTSSIFTLVNANAGANTNFRAGTASDTIQLGYDGNNGYSYINVDGFSNDRLAFRADGTGFASFLKTGLFGIGTITPTLGKIQINGGTQNVANEETGLHIRGSLSNIKIELQSTAVGGKLYELRSTSTGSLDITDRTAGITRYILDNNGNHIFLNTSYGRRVSGMITMQNNATATTITTGGVFVKVAGTTTPSNLNAVLAPVSNRITSNTSIAHIAKIDCSFTAIHNGGGGDEITFALYRNGVQLGNTLISTQSANNLKSLSISTVVAMPTLGDFIELWCTHPTNARTITVKHFIMAYSTT